MFSTPSAPALSPATRPVSEPVVIRRSKATTMSAEDTVAVLYAEHNPLDIDLTRRHFERHAANIQLDGVHDAAAVMARLQQPAGEDGPCDVLLLDYRLAGDTRLGA